MPGPSSPAPAVPIDRERLAGAFETIRAELTAYLCRLVVRQDVARELAQSTFVRALEARASAPEEHDARRRWLFRIATNLAIDERRRHGAWRETLMQEGELYAVRDHATARRIEALAGRPEVEAIAKEHLAICLACVLGELPSQHAAALLLREVHDFELKASAQVLDATTTQVKNWLQKARAAMRRRYATSCALVTKQGACYQCVKLEERVGGRGGDPLAGASDTVEGRLAVLRELRTQPESTWGGVVASIFAAID